MRLLELALLALTSAGAVRPMTAWRRSPSFAIAIAIGTLAATVVHVLAEGPRWQMAPVYLVAVGTAGVAAADARRPREPSRRWAPAAVALVLVTTAAALGWALPVTRLPAPEGPHPVGTTELVVIDDDRAERYGDRPGGSRELAVQVWYPAASDTEGPASPWTSQPRAFARSAAAHFDVPAFALSHLGLVRSHAIADATPAPAAQRPLVVYSHGWSGFRTAQSSLMESLASHGFVVAAVDHTHASLASVFPDGHVVPLDPAALPEDGDEETYETASTRLVETFAADIEVVVAQLRADGPLADGASSSVGLVGHSTGGGAAILACTRMPACEAVVGHDPWVEPLADEQVGEGLDRPLLSLRSEEWVGIGNDARLRRLHAASADANGRVAIAGAAHRDFTLGPLLSPLSHLSPLDDGARPREVHRVVDDWTVSFLSHHLRGTRRDPLERPLPHPEATLER